MKLSSLLWKTLVVALLALGLLAPFTAADSNDDAVAHSFIGTWRLVKITGVGKGAGPNDHPTGYIIYDNTGHMAVQECFDPLRPAMARGPNGVSVEDKANSFDDYAAYFGTYTVDAKAGTVTHHLEGSISPGAIGHNNVRYFEMKGNQVTLYDAAVVNGVLQRKDQTTRSLTWERVPLK